MRLNPRVIQQRHYVAPSLRVSAFHCPHPGCGAYADQPTFVVFIRPPTTVSFTELQDWAVTRCRLCHGIAFWKNGVMNHPQMGSGPDPADDMPEKVLAVYEEASQVLSISRKSAAALLRLALQILVDDLEPGSGTINAKIGKLVANGLDPRVQQAMDVLRVIGNDSVHPGQINLDDEDIATTHALFDLLNLIVEQVITRPNQVTDMFARLPEDKRKGIEQRDKTD